MTKIAAKARNIVKSRQEEQTFRENTNFVKHLADTSAASRKLIIDCGFNEGIVARRLLAELPDFSLVGFEVQQDLQQCAEDLKSRLPGRDIEVVYSAISNKAGTIQYFEPRKWGKNYKGGTTIVDKKKSMDINYDEPHLAPAIDFARWLRDNVSADWFVFVKMDIEGAEYDVIEHLLNTGSIELIDVLAVEWHAEKFPEPLRTRYRGIEQELKRFGDDNHVTVIDWY